MKKTIQISDDRMNELAVMVAKKTYKMFYKQLENMISSNPDLKEASPADFINIVLLSITCIDSNIIKLLQTFHKGKTGHDLDFNKLVCAYISNFNDVINAESREKMN